MFKFEDFCSVFFSYDRNMKFLKWWLQSYLVDIQLIKVGLRDDFGIVSKIVDCKTSDLYKASSQFKVFKFLDHFI